MTKPSPATRALRLGTAALLAMGAVALTGPSASAAPWTGTYGRTTGFSYSGAGCAVSGPGTTLGPTPISSNSATSVDHSGAVTGTGPTAPDTATMSASTTGSATITEAAGSVTDLDLNLHMVTSAHRALGAASACSAAAQALTSLGGTFSTASPAVLDLDIASLGTGSRVLTVSLVRINPAPLAGSLTSTFDEIGRSKRVVVVPAGDWSVSISAQSMSTDSNTPGSPPASDAQIHLHGAFRTLGSAVGATAGAGTKYLAFGDGQTCATHSVLADFTDKAGKKPKHGKKPVIKKATFFVNDVKVKTVKKPNKNTVVTIDGLPAQEDARVSAELKLTGKGTTSVARVYYPCG